MNDASQWNTPLISVATALLFGCLAAGSVWLHSGSSGIVEYFGIAAIIGALVGAVVSHLRNTAMQGFLAAASFLGALAGYFSSNRPR